MDNDQRMLQLEEKINKIYISVEKTRKYFFWTMVISVVLVVLPAIGLVFVIPQFISSYVTPIQSMTSQ
jgi:type IV secretory pathway component VirB8